MPAGLNSLTGVPAGLYSLTGVPAGLSLLSNDVSRRTKWPVAGRRSTCRRGKKERTKLVLCLYQQFWQNICPCKCCFELGQVSIYGICPKLDMNLLKKPVNFTLLRCLPRNYLSLTGCSGVDLRKTSDPATVGQLTPILVACLLTQRRGLSCVSLDTWEETEGLRALLPIQNLCIFTV